MFKINKENNDGVCADPKDVPECVNYYGDLKFDPSELVRAGVDPEVVGIKPTKPLSGKQIYIKICKFCPSGCLSVHLFVCPRKITNFPLNTFLRVSSFVLKTSAGA